MTSSWSINSVSWVSWSHRDLIVVDRLRIMGTMISSWPHRGRSTWEWPWTKKKRYKVFRIYLNSQHASWWCHRDLIVVDQLCVMGIMISSWSIDSVSWVSWSHRDLIVVDQLCVMGIMISSWPHRGRSTWEWPWTKKKIKSFSHLPEFSTCFMMMSWVYRVHVMGVLGPCHGYHDLIVTSSWSIDSVSWVSWYHRDFIVVDQHENDHEPKKKIKSFSHLPEFLICFMMMSWVHRVHVMGVSGPCHGYHDLIVTSSWLIDTRMTMNQKKNKKFFAFTWILDMLHDDVMGPSGPCHGCLRSVSWVSWASQVRVMGIMISSWPHRGRSTQEWPWTKKK